MAAASWFVIFGAVFIVMGISASLVRRLPLTTSLLYLLIGAVLGPAGFGFFYLNPVENSALLERGTEIVVVVSLFAAGLKLRIPWGDPRWKIALRLAFGSMVVTVGLIALIAFYGLGLPLGAAILLGAILAPTDPVLASDVQVRSPEDQDQLRFSLTSEAGLNDGAAFPFVMLGLGFLGLHDLGEYGLRWLVLDVLWAIVGGIAIGAALGTLLSRLVMRMRARRKESVVLDDFLALGLIALSYGLALWLHTYGFLAVFAAGLALRRTERQLSGDKPPAQVKELAALGSQDEVLASEPDKVPAYTAQAVLFFNEQLERLGEVAMVVLLGGMVSSVSSLFNDFWFVLVLFVLVRPACVFVGLWASAVPMVHRRLVAWFGIRGIGSLYYLTYAIKRGLAPELAQRLSLLTITVVASSIVVHGISVTPLMNIHGRKSARRNSAQ